MSLEFRRLDGDNLQVPPVTRARGVPRDDVRSMETDLDTSFAYRVFSEHQTEINHIYWCITRHCTGLRSLWTASPRRTGQMSFFRIRNRERSRDIKLEYWSRDYEAFDNWTRLAAVIAITGYFEIFLKNLADAACQSCPSVLVGGYKEFDGLRLLKTLPDFGFRKQAEACCNGKWSARVKAYRDLFGECPQFIKDHTTDLDKLRILRNTVGHSFGRTLDDAKVGRSLVSEAPKKVMQTELIYYLDLVNKVAMSVDENLSCKIVGAYEILAHYHFWSGKNGTAREQAKKFRKHVQSQVQADAINEYYVGMIEYCRSGLADDEATPRLG